MSKLEFTIALLLSAGTLFAQLSEQQVRRVDQVFDDWKTSTGPGGSVVVIHEGQMVYKKGFGVADLEHDIPITVQSVFYAGSVSKQFVAASIAILLVTDFGKTLSL